MTSKNTSEKILNLASAIISLITTHEDKTSSSTQQGHAKAGSAPQTIGKSLSAGTDNGYYARADHVHTVDFSNILNAPSALDVVDNLTTDDGGKPLSAKQGKALNESKADTNHTHANYITEDDIELEYDDETGILSINIL